MIRLAVADSGRPPGWFSLVRIKLDGSPSDWFPSIVRMVDLLSWLQQLDIRLGKNAAVGLLKIFKSLLVDANHGSWILERQQAFVAGRNCQRRIQTGVVLFKVGKLSLKGVGLPTTYVLRLLPKWHSIPWLLCWSRFSRSLWHVVSFWISRCRGLLLWSQAVHFHGDTTKQCQHCQPPTSACGYAAINACLQWIFRSRCGWTFRLLSMSARIAFVKSAVCRPVRLIRTNWPAVGTRNRSWASIS